MTGWRQLNLIEDSSIFFTERRGFSAMKTMQLGCALSSVGSDSGILKRLDRSAPDTLGVVWDKRWESQSFPSVRVVSHFTLKQNDLLCGGRTFFHLRRGDRVIAKVVLCSQLGD